MVEENRIFVGALSQNTTEASLLDYFMLHRGVDVKVMMDQQTGRNRGFGFVTFQDSEAVQAVLMQQHTVDGKAVDCKESVVKGMTPRPVGPQGSGKGGGGQAMAVLPASGSAPNQHKIFVGGLSQNSSKDSMEMYFGSFGICECVVMLDRDSGRSRGFGFAVFASQEDVLKVLSFSGGHVLDGKQVECKACEENHVKNDMGMTGNPEADRIQHMLRMQQGGGAQQGQGHPMGKGGQPEMDGRRLFVGGLPQGCDSDRLGQQFSQFGAVIDAKVHVDTATQRSKGFGYVSFDDPVCVEMALAMSNGGKLDLDGKIVEIKRSEARGQKGSSGGGGGGGGGFQQPQVAVDFSSLLDPGSPALQAAQMLNPAHGQQIRGMVHLLQDPACCAVIQGLIAKIHSAPPAQGNLQQQKMAAMRNGGGNRWSPY